MIRKWVSELWSEIKQNYFKQSKTERVYWVIICFSIALFGLYVDMFWFSIFISLVVVLLGTLALEINKPVVLMVATLFFTIVIFSEQSKNLFILLKYYIIKKMLLFEVSALAIQNLGGHTFPEETEQRAIEYISLLSLLAYLVQKETKRSRP